MLISRISFNAEFSERILEMLLKRLSIEEMSQAMGMFTTSASLRTVAAYFNVSRNVIRRVRMRNRNTGSAQYYGLVSKD